MVDSTGVFDTRCVGWPRSLEGSFLRLPTTLTDHFHRHFSPRSRPRGVVSASGEYSAAINNLGDLIATRVHAGGGLAIVTGDGLANMSDDALAGLHISLARSLGELVGQTGCNETLVEVMSRTTAAPRRGYQDNDGMLLHSDASDFSGLLCLSQGVTGGASLFASAGSIHDVLAREVPDLLGLYYRDWSWNVGALGFRDVPPHLPLPIFSLHRGRLSCRYSPSLLRGGALAVGKALTEEQSRALDRFEAVALREGLVARYRLARGESAWMNNQTLLHGRDAFRDGETANQTRRLLRVWSRSGQAHRLWPRVANFDDQLFRGLRA